jgi:hypothetical protein
MLFPACSFSFLAFPCHIMTSAFRAKPQQFFFKNVCVHTEIKDSVFLSRKKIRTKNLEIFFACRTELSYDCIAPKTQKYSRKYLANDEKWDS